MDQKVRELEERVAALERLLIGDAARIDPLRLYEPAEVAAMLGCSRTNVYDLMMAGDLAKRAIGAGKKGFKVMGSDILAFLDSRKEGGPSPKGSFKYLRNPS
jgi:predicted DNA-binding transcriptional regulator AlpA